MNQSTYRTSRRVQQGPRPSGPMATPKAAAPAQPAERELPPQRRYIRVAWESLGVGGRYGAHGNPFSEN